MTADIKEIQGLLSTVVSATKIGDVVVCDIDRLYDVRQACRQLLDHIEGLEKEVSEERKLKRETLDKFADYCIERNEHVSQVARLSVQIKRVAELTEETGVWKEMFERQGERIERIEKSAQDLIDSIGPCVCDEAFTSRKLRDPGCGHHNNQPEIDELRRVLRLKERTKK